MDEYVSQIAKVLHEIYEEAAVKAGWNTRPECKVPFEDLPPANQETMKMVALEICLFGSDRVIERELELLERALDISTVETWPVVRKILDRVVNGVRTREFEDPKDEMRHLREKLQERERREDSQEDGSRG